jgi:hypothetical protein
VTIASRPSGGRDSEGYECDLGKTESKKFLGLGLDWWNQIELLQQIPWLRSPDSSMLRIVPE